MKVSKWGNSLAIRLPAPLAEALRLKSGDDISATIGQPDDASITSKPTDEDVLARLRELRKRLPADFKFNREEANER